MAVVGGWGLGASTQLPSELFYESMICVGFHRMVGPGADLILERVRECIKRTSAVQQVRQFAFDRGRVDMHPTRTTTTMSRSAF